MLGSELRRYKDGQKYLVHDVESEDLNLGFTRPWELSFGICTNKTIEKIETYLIRWPDLHVSDEAARITHFDHKRYEAEARDPKEVLDIYEGYLYDPQYEIVGQNQFQFDFYVHKNWRRALGREEDYSYVPRCIDLMVLSKCYFKGWKPDLEHWEAFSYKAMNFREKGLRTSLEYVAKALGIEYDPNELHRAGKDVELTIMCLQKLLWSVEC